MADDRTDTASAATCSRRSYAAAISCSISGRHRRRHDAGPGSRRRSPRRFRGRVVDAFERRLDPGEQAVLLEVPPVGTGRHAERRGNRNTGGDQFAEVGALPADQRHAVRVDIREAADDRIHEWFPLSSGQSDQLLDNINMTVNNAGDAVNGSGNDIDRRRALRPGRDPVRIRAPQRDAPTQRHSPWSEWVSRPMTQQSSPPDGRRRSRSSASTHRSRSSCTGTCSVTASPGRPPCSA